MANDRDVNELADKIQSCADIPDGVPWSQEELDLIEAALRAYSRPSTAGPQRVDQTELGPLGNCQSACLSMLIGVPLAEIPNFAAIAKGDGNVFFHRQNDWLNARGWGLLTIVRHQALPWPPKHGWYIAGGASPRGNRHAVVFKDGALWHDPHPEHAGIGDVEDVDILYPLRPFARSSTLPSEPTRAMLDAWWDVMRGIGRNRPSTVWPGLHYSDSESLMVDAYQAMLGAAPAYAAPEDKDTRILELHSNLYHALQNTDEAIEHFENFTGQVLGWCEEAVAHFAQSADDAKAEHRWSERARLVRKLLEQPA